MCIYCYHLLVVAIPVGGTTGVIVGVYFVGVLTTLLFVGPIVVIVFIILRSK